MGFDVELVLAEERARLTGHVGGGHVAEALEPLAALGQLDHATCAVDVDAAGLVERKVERH